MYMITTQFLITLFLWILTEVGEACIITFQLKKKKNHHQHPFIMELLSWLGTCLKVSRTASSVANHESLGHVKWSYLTGSLMCAMLSWSLTPCRLTLSGTNFHFLSPVGMDPDTLLSDSNQCQTPITLAKIFEVKMKVSLWSRNQ